MTVTVERATYEVNPSDVEGEEYDVPPYGSELGATASQRGRGVKIMRAGRVMRDVLTRGLAMSGACLAALAAGAALHRGSAWAGINAIPSGMGFMTRRSSKHFDARLAALSIGTVIGGSLVMALLQRTVTSRFRFGRGRIGTAAIASLGSWAMDRYLMRRSLIPALQNTLGLGGTVAKYSALGIASALARRA